MVELQILNRVLKDKNTSLLDLNDITRDYFNQYQEEYDYTRDEFASYGDNISLIPKSDVKKQK